VPLPQLPASSLEFVRGLVQASLLDAATVRARLKLVTAPAEIVKSAERQIGALFGAPKS